MNKKLANEVADLKSLGQRGLTREQINLWILLLLGHLNQEDADRVVHHAVLILYQRRNANWARVIAEAPDVVRAVDLEEVYEMFGNVLPGRRAA